MIYLNMETPEHIDLPPDAADEPMDVDGLARKFQKELNSGLIALVLLGWAAQRRRPKLSGAAKPRATHTNGNT